MSKKPPSSGMYIAIALELAMLGAFIGAHSWAGVFLWSMYLYFSATRALVEGIWRDD